MKTIAAHPFRRIVTPHGMPWIVAIALTPGCAIDLGAPPGTDAPPDSPSPTCDETRSTARPVPGPIQIDTGFYGAGRLALPAVDVGPLPPLRRPPRPLARDRSAPPRVALRLLVLGVDDDQPSYLAARAAVEHIGVPHQAVALDSTSFGQVRLFESDRTCRFTGLILATSELAADDPVTGEYRSALSESDWERLARYQQRCAAREVVWYAYPGPDHGLATDTSFDGTEAVAGELTDPGAALFSDLIPAAEVSIEGVWGYRAAVADAATTPLLRTESGSVLAAHHRRPDGTEVVAVTVGSGPRSLHSMLLQHGLIDWLFRGLMPGKRRVYLSTQIDDVFLASRLWRADGSEAEYRMVPADVAELAAWQSQLRVRLPPGSTFTSQLAFNGVGVAPLEEPDSLLETLLEHREQLEWINHTWDHADMGAMSAEVAVQEIASNCALADQVSLEPFECASAVTPHVSGLDNPDALDGMAEAGVRFVVSDTSITEAIAPENPGTNPSHNVGRVNRHDPRIYQVPRYPTNIFYKASVPAEEAGLYNELYAEHLEEELTYEQILARDSAVGLSYLLSYDANPLMFHQANLRFWEDESGQPRSLYTDWMDAALDRYLAAMRLPILTLSMSELAALMQARAAYDACALDAVLVDDGEGRRLELTAGPSPCVVPLTGLDAPSLGPVEHYAGEPTTHIALDGGCETTTIELP
jgi:hypothetical protein